MSLNNESQTQSGGAAVEKTLPQGGVYASLFEKINLTPVAKLGELDGFQDNNIMAETSADARVTAAVQVFMQCLKKSGQTVEKLDKTLLDHHIAELDFQISRQLDEVMHNDEFQKVESVWRGLKSLVDKTDFRQNVKLEMLDLSKDELRQDFEDSPEIIQSGLYRQTYIAEYDTPGGEPIGAIISAYEFDASAQDVALMRNLSKVSAAAHMPFIGSAGPAFFLKDSMEEVAAIKDIGNYFDRAEYIKWKSFRETDDSRYIGLVMPRVLGRLPYGPDIAHYLKLIQRENIGTTKDRRLLELELNTWVRGLVTEMTDPGDELQASHPLRDAKVLVEDIEDNPGFFRVKLYAIPHFQVEGMDVNLSLVSQMPKAKS